MFLRRVAPTPQHVEFAFNLVVSGDLSEEQRKNLTSAVDDCIADVQGKLSTNTLLSSKNITLSQKHRFIPYVEDSEEPTNPTTPSVASKQFLEKLIASRLAQRPTTHSSSQTFEETPAAPPTAPTASLSVTPQQTPAVQPQKTPCTDSALPTTATPPKIASQKPKKHAVTVVKIAIPTAPKTKPSASSAPQPSIDKKPLWSILDNPKTTTSMILGFDKIHEEFRPHFSVLKDTILGIQQLTQQGLELKKPALLPYLGVLHEYHRTEHTQSIHKSKLWHHLHSVINSARSRIRKNCISKKALADSILGAPIPEAHALEAIALENSLKSDLPSAPITPKRKKQAKASGKPVRKEAEVIVISDDEDEPNPANESTRAERKRKAREEEEEREMSKLVPESPDNLVCTLKVSPPRRRRRVRV